MKTERSKEAWFVEKMSHCQMPLVFLQGSQKQCFKNNVIRQFISRENNRNTTNCA
jgi:hypothetical protein